jgi:hypothetical protein
MPLGVRAVLEVVLLEGEEAAPAEAAAEGEEEAEDVPDATAAAAAAAVVEAAESEDTATLIPPMTDGAGVVELADAPVAVAVASPSAADAALLTRQVLPF